jgi:hypothetical protein
MWPPEDLGPIPLLGTFQPQKGDLAKDSKGQVFIWEGSGWMNGNGAWRLPKNDTKIVQVELKYGTEPIMEQRCEHCESRFVLVFGDRETERPKYCPNCGRFNTSE